MLLLTKIFKAVYIYISSARVMEQHIVTRSIKAQDVTFANYAIFLGHLRPFVQRAPFIMSPTSEACTCRYIP